VSKDYLSKKFGVPGPVNRPSSPGPANPYPKFASSSLTIPPTSTCWFLDSRRPALTSRESPSSHVLIYAAHDGVVDDTILEETIMRLYASGVDEPIFSR
jgi:hypothetical protein